MAYDANRGVYVFIPPVEPRTQSSRVIMGEDNAHQPGLLDFALEEFLAKNDDYDDASDALGIVGQVSDLWRKIVKIKKAVIDGKPLNGESVALLIRDVFGHALLAMYYDEMGVRDRKRRQYPISAQQPEDEDDRLDAVSVNEEAEPVDVGARSPAQARALARVRMEMAEARKLGASSDQLEAVVWEEFHSGQSVTDQIRQSLLKARGAGLSWDKIAQIVGATAREV